MALCVQNNTLKALAESNDLNVLYFYTVILTSLAILYEFHAV